VLPPFPVVEKDGIRLKFNPFANVPRQRIEGDLRGCKLRKRISNGIGWVCVMAGRNECLNQPGNRPMKDCPCRPLARKQNETADAGIQRSRFVRMKRCNAREHMKWVSVDLEQPVTKLYRRAGT